MLALMFAAVAAGAVLLGITLSPAPTVQTPLIHRVIQVHRVPQVRPTAPCHLLGSQVRMCR